MFFKWKFGCQNAARQEETSGEGRTPLALWENSSNVTTSVDEYKYLITTLISITYGRYYANEMDSSIQFKRFHHQSEDTNPPDTKITDICKSTVIIIIIKKSKKIRLNQVLIVRLLNCLLLLWWNELKSNDMHEMCTHVLIDAGNNCCQCCHSHDNYS